MKRIMGIFLIATIITSYFSCAIPSSFNDDGLQDSPWPMFRHDVMHTGGSEYDTSKNYGKEKWRFKVDGWIDSSPAIAKDGTIYVGACGYYGPLYAIYPNGSLKWEFRTNPSSAAVGWIKSSPAIAKDGTIYVGSLDMNLYAINPDGTLKWKFNCHSPVFSSPAIAKDGTIYIGVTGPGWNKGRLYALNPDGTEKWHFDTGWWIYSSPAIGNDGTIYVGSHDCYLYAINPDGTLKWRFKARKEIKSSPAIAKDGTIYVGSWDQYLYAINPDGTLKWKFKATPGSGAIDSSPAIAEDGTIYFGDCAGKLFALNPDGSLKWSIQLTPNSEFPIYSSPAISKEGTIYVGGMDGKLYAIYPDGEIKWKIKLGDDIVSSPAIAKDGTIYVGGSDLYAIFGGIKIKKPKEGYLYIANKEIFYVGNTIIIGKIDIEVDSYDEDIEKVEFYIDEKLIGVDEKAPFEIVLDERTFWKHKIKAKACYHDKTTFTDEIKVLIFNI